MGSETNLQKLDPERTNFVERFNLENLPEFVKARKFAVVLFNRAEEGTFKHNLVFFGVGKAFEKREVFFLQIDVADYSPDQLKAYNVLTIPTVLFYIYGNAKHFALPFNAENLTEWLDQSLQANIHSVSLLEEIHPNDKHYFVHVRKEWADANKAHFSVLAKLVSPLGIYTGLPDAELAKITKESKMLEPFVAFREIDEAAIPVEKSLSLAEKAKIIVANEFSDWIDCSDKGLRLLLEYKIPALIYFGQSAIKDENWKVVESAHKFYKDYLLLFYVDLSGSNKKCLFLADFLDVDEPESLRILDLTRSAKRYKHIGAFLSNELNFFLTNYVEGNLKHFSLNEKVKKGQNHKGLLKGNFKILREASKKLRDNSLFYVFSERLAPITKRDLRILRVIKAVTSSNSTFKIFTVNHDKNDIDGQMHKKMPFIFLIGRTGKVSYFEEKTLTEKALLLFILKEVPYLKLTDPEEREDEDL